MYLSLRCRWELPGGQGEEGKKEGRVGLGMAHADGTKPQFVPLPRFPVGKWKPEHDVCYLQSPTLRLRMAPPKTPPQHCVIGADGGPSILLTCSSVHRGDFLRVPF